MLYFCGWFIVVSQKELFFVVVFSKRVWLPDFRLCVFFSVPTAAPRDIAVEVFNTTVLRVSWTPAPPATVRGHLGGYDVSKHGFKAQFPQVVKENKGTQSTKLFSGEEVSSRFLYKIETKRQ